MEYTNFNWDDYMDEIKSLAERIKMDYNGLTVDQQANKIVEWMEVANDV